MQVLIGMVLIACLLGSNPSDRVPPNDLFGDLALAVVVLLAVPLAAGLQTLFCRRVLHSERWSRSARQRTLQRMMNVHLLLWACGAMVLLTTAHWPGIVRENWDLDRWPLVDEFALFSPLALSLVLSWALFYELGPTEGTFDLAARWRFVALRFRLYFALTLVPLLGVCALQDSGLDWDSLTLLESSLLAAALGLIGMAGFPFVICWLWPSQPLDRNPLSRRLQQISKTHKLHLRGIRIWQTNGQMLNAVLIGVLPGCRFLLLTDALVQRFPDDQIAAIVLHEAGHVRHHHLPIRIGFILVPLLMIASLDIQALDSLIPFSFAWLAVGYITWWVVAFGWMSRGMEFEADLYALRSLPADRRHSVVDALLTFGQSMPSQYHRGSITHPSLAARIEFLTRAEEDPGWADRFCRRFHNQQIALAIGISAAFVAFRWIASLLGI